MDTASFETVVLLKVLDTCELAEEFEEFGGVQLVDRAFDRLGQEVELVETTFVLVVVFIIDPSIRLVELVEFCDAVFQHFGIQEVLQYDVGVWTCFLIPFAQFIQLACPFAIIKDLSRGCHFWIFLFGLSKGQRYQNPAILAHRTVIGELNCGRPVNRGGTPG